MSHPPQRGKKKRETGKSSHCAVSMIQHQLSTCSHPHIALCFVILKGKHRSLSQNCVPAADTRCEPPQWMSLRNIFLYSSPLGTQWCSPSSLKKVHNQDINRKATASRIAQLIYIYDSFFYFYYYYFHGFVTHISVRLFTIIAYDCIQFLSGL